MRYSGYYSGTTVEPYIQRHPYAKSATKVAQKKVLGIVFFFNSSCINVKADVSLPVFIQVAKNDISSVAPYGICRFFDGNPHACDPDGMLYLINHSS
jgi:hypothetical protein